ncbi:Flp family type IVb pilin [Planctellipticum variicoloris]|jgi:Flp pilus assembly pilin Flp|uniref:Flp family type IVb pilin n=1 Tax=Planctellipticum variicoloris TaxID=3064265 RepID=UPI002D0CA9F7|nr:hypothetical protein SH412_000587 [Planctomycetaceae bacterium SH412]HTN04488.1 hypothetical protein [Planctomycetaceae bacterium]
MSLFARFMKEEAGFVVSSELVLIATIVVIGLIAGLTTLRDQVLQEIADVADAISEVNQSYSYSGVTSHTGSTAGSVFVDTEDFCDVDGNSNLGAGVAAQCITLTIPATAE